MLVVTFVPFLMLLILFGSVALIYNSFSISLSERTRQMGILNSVGATKKQLRASVRYEAFVLCLIGVPLGILSGIAGIGVTFYLLRDSILSALGNGLYIKLAVSSWAVVISAIVAVFTVFLSASIPARRALRFNAVEAIRQTSDVKMPKRMGKGGLWSRIFHLEGQLAYKNSRRFKKRHNATVFSIVVSIVLFVAAYTFSTDLAMSAYFSSEVSSYDMFCTVLLFRDKEELLSLYKDLSSIPEVKNSALIYERGYALLPLAGAPVLTDASKYDEHLTGAEELYCQIMTVDRENYLKLLEAAGIAIPPQGEEFPALLIDHNTKVTEKPDGSRYYENYSIFDHDAFPFTFSVIPTIL